MEQSALRLYNSVTVIMSAEYSVSGGLTAENGQTISPWINNIITVYVIQWKNVGESKKRGFYIKEEPSQSRIVINVTYGLT
jgi:hypothetical protein